MSAQYEQIVGARYHIYNSLFLNLPFHHILRTGTLLPLLHQYCEAGFERGDSAKDIIKKFFADLVPHASEKDQFDLLFNFIQYVERQVALFDSIEDSQFLQINDLRGKGSVSSLLFQAKLENKVEQLKTKLEEFSLRIVLTAHPTQFYPGHVLGILTDLERSIRDHDLDQINLLLQQLGKTGFINKEKPTPYDEAVSLCWYLENVFYHSIPKIISSLLEGLQLSVSDWKNDRLIVIGFWPGGDRDGNPFVTSDITLKVAARLQEAILKCYFRDARFLRRRLTFEGVDKSIIDIERRLNEMVAGRGEPYNHVDELLSELQGIRKTLVEKHDSLFVDLLDAFTLKVRIFGFHFASLDIRQDSRKHDAVWKAILEKLHAEQKGIPFDSYSKLSDQDKIKHLLSLTADIGSLTFDDALATDTIQSVKAIATIQKNNGTAGSHRYVISNCQHALHVIEVFTLGRLLIGKGEELSLDVVPLFETIDDLAHAPEIMAELYAIPVYREHLTRRKDKQSIMLGFSDGTKDGGYLRANWSIFRAKEELTAVSRNNGLKALFFDGRGGPPARGGGNTHDFYASLGDTIENEEVQITIQGQTISSNFGKEASSKYNLEQLLSAGLIGDVFKHADNKLSNEDKKLLDELAEEGYQAYLKLKLDPKFVPYLEKVTPLSSFGDSNIGSRPVKRGGSDALKFEDLRAIPFVGAWAQMKQNIPGFYGVGSAITRMIEKGKGDQLKNLYKNSLFFRTLLSNSMMSLTKTNYKATTYLGSDPEFGDFWKKMFAEYELSVKRTLEISGLSDLMGNSPNIRDSVKLRERIVLPLIAIQQFALMNLRTSNELSKEHETRYRKLIIRCTFGIINAARNSA
jgi:phosphoenolpyruvate carboxylase